MMPEIHKKMLPYIDEAAEFYGGTDKFNEDKLKNMTEYVMARSNFRSDPPDGYTEAAAGDIARGLILGRLFGYPYYEGYYPYYSYPYYDGYYPYYYDYYGANGYYPYYGGGYGGRFRGYRDGFRGRGRR